MAHCGCLKTIYYSLLLLITFSVLCESVKILIVGSINADTFLPVARLPTEGENLTLLPGSTPTVDVPGGKGCTQAVAVAKLLNVRNIRQDNNNNKNDNNDVVNSVCFVGQFGNDGAAVILQHALQNEGVDISSCGHHDDLPSGRGYVFLASNGQVSAVISGGSNTEGWQDWKDAWDELQEKEETDESTASLEHPVFDTLNKLLDGCQCVMLQREVPEFVNQLVAKYARLCNGGNTIIIQDVGGEDRPIDSTHLQYCDYLIPNETELARLVHSLGGQTQSSDVVTMARFLQNEHGAHNVLVTQGCRGCTFVPKEPANAPVVHQPALPVEHVVDETGAGDAFRAAFAVAILEQKQINNSTTFGANLRVVLNWASAAGACAVGRFGAVPSTPTRQDVERVSHIARVEESVLHIPRGDGLRGGDIDNNNDFDFLIGSRLNSMKDRPELWSQPLLNARDYVRRQATIKGLTCVDFNYPQHFGDCWSSIKEAREALKDNGLDAGAVCLRYPSKFARGAMNHPDPTMRQEAIDLTKEAASVAIELGCNEVVVWSAYDGYDYPFQVNYDDKWDELVHAFRECCDAYPDIKFSVEYKPTDENTRFFTIPSTGAALLMVNEVDRSNFGLTLDVGHMLMSGENPGQSIAMVGRAGKLFGVQLNDGYTRLAAEDGLMFGSVHPSMALEIMYQLRRTNFKGHLYFDTFPQRSDPILEAEYNIERVKAFWKAAGSFDSTRVARIMAEHDAVGSLRLIDNAMRQM